MTTIIQDFKEWVEDGNAVRIADDHWIEQTTQWRQSFTLAELKAFFIREFRS